MYETMIMAVMKALRDDDDDEDEQDLESASDVSKAAERIGCFIFRCVSHEPWLVCLSQDRCRWRHAVTGNEVLSFKSNKCMVLRDDIGLLLFDDLLSSVAVRRDLSKIKQKSLVSISSFHGVSMRTAVKSLLRPSWRAMHAHLPCIITFTSREMSRSRASFIGSVKQAILGQGR